LAHSIAVPAAEEAVNCAVEEPHGAGGAEATDGDVLWGEAAIGAVQDCTAEKGSDVVRGDGGPGRRGGIMIGTKQGVGGAPWVWRWARRRSAD